MFLNELEIGGSCKVANITKDNIKFKSYDIKEGSILKLIRKNLFGMNLLFLVNNESMVALRANELKSIQIAI